MYPVTKPVYDYQQRYDSCTKNCRYSAHSNKLHQETAAAGSKRGSNWLDHFFGNVTEGQKTVQCVSAA